VAVVVFHFAAEVPYSTSIEYYAYDALGNVRVVLSSTGARLNTLAYRPFGICAYGCSSEPQYGYTGEYREGFVGGPQGGPNLIYLHSRWMDPTIGRFISPDDRLGSLSVPQTQHRYVYVGNNPLKYTDPAGHDMAGDLGNLAFCLFFGAVCLANQAASTAAWHGGTDDANRAGFWARVLTAFAIGLVVALVCAGARNTSRGFS